MKQWTPEYEQEWKAICESRAKMARDIRREIFFGWLLSFAIVSFGWWLLLQY